MTFVPVVPNPPPPSPRADELGRRLTETIAGFRQEEPALSSVEIRQAVSLALRRAGVGGSGIAVVVAVLFLTLGLGVFFYFTQSGLDFADQPLILMLVVGTAIAGIGIAKALCR